MTYHYRKTKDRGYSLVEVLVAITVLLIALVGPLTIAHSGLKRSVQSKDSTQAVFLAQEGIEAVVKLREDAALAASAYNNIGQIWDTTFDTLHSRCSGSAGCGVTIANDGTVTTSSIYQCSGSNCLIKYQGSDRVPYKQGGAVAGTDTIFTRSVQVNVTGDSHARVRSTVSWTGANPSSVTLETYVYNIYYEP